MSTRMMTGAWARGRVEASNDEALLARIRQSDRDAFEALYARYSGSVLSLAEGMLRHTVLAQDVTQDVFLAIWCGARQFDAHRGSARAWIFSVAHHKTIDAVRRSQRHFTTALSDAIEHEEDVLEVAQARVHADHVRRALEALSAEQRTAIVLAYYGGYTQREIATRLGVPLGTIKTRIRDGLLRLRIALGRLIEEAAR